MGDIGPQLMKGTVPVGAGTFLRKVSTIADTVTLEPEATVKPGEVMAIDGDGYLTLTGRPGEVELP